MSLTYSFAMVIDILIQYSIYAANSYHEFRNRKAFIHKWNTILKLGDYIKIKWPLGRLGFFFFFVVAGLVVTRSHPQALGVHCE